MRLHHASPSISGCPPRFHLRQTFCHVPSHAKGPTCWKTTLGCKAQPPVSKANTLALPPTELRTDLLRGPHSEMFADEEHDYGGALGQMQSRHLEGCTMYAAPMKCEGAPALNYYLQPLQVASAFARRHSSPSLYPHSSKHHDCYSYQKILITTIGMNRSSHAYIHVDVRVCACVCAEALM